LPLNLQTAEEVILASLAVTTNEEFLVVGPTPEFVSRPATLDATPASDGQGPAAAKSVLGDFIQKLLHLNRFLIHNFVYITPISALVKPLF
jgi:hypothetical protein